MLISFIFTTHSCPKSTSPNFRSFVSICTGRATKFNVIVLLPAWQSLNRTDFCSFSKICAVAIFLNFEEHSLFNNTDQFDVSSTEMSKLKRTNISKNLLIESDVHVYNQCKYFRFAFGKSHKISK